MLRRRSLAVLVVLPLGAEPREPRHLLLEPAGVARARRAAMVAPTHPAAFEPSSGCGRRAHTDHREQKHCSGRTAHMREATRAPGAGLHRASGELVRRRTALRWRTANARAGAAVAAAPAAATQPPHAVLVGMASSVGHRAAVRVHDARGGPARMGPPAKSTATGRSHRSHRSGILLRLVTCMRLSAVRHWSAALVGAAGSPEPRAPAS